MYIVLSLIFLTVNALNRERPFIIWAAKPSQHIGSKGIWILKFESKNMVLWRMERRGGNIVNTAHIFEILRNKIVFENKGSGFRLSH